MSHSLLNDLKRPRRKPTDYFDTPNKGAIYQDPATLEGDLQFHFET